MGLTPHQLIRSNADLVSLPDIIFRINDCLNSPESTAADIAHIISTDPGLTARILKIVNSAFYGFPAQIDSLSMAITVLGTRQIRDLVMATSILNNFHKYPNGEFDAEKFWCHSLATALVCREFANIIRSEKTEQFFIAGLLHDIGKLLMYSAQPDPSMQVIEAAQHPAANLERVEREVFGFDHGELGAELLRYWRIPESIVEAINYHHYPLQASNYRYEAAAVHLANVIANNLQPALSIDDDLVADPKAWEVLGLSPEVEEMISEKLLTMMDDILSMFYYEQTKAA